MPKHSLHPYSGKRSSQAGADESSIWGIPRYSVAVGSFILLCLTTYFLPEHTISLPGNDAAGYLQLGQTWNSNSADQLRTYLYPFILSHLIRISHFLTLPFTFLLILLQAGSYIIAAVTLARAMRSQNQTLAGAVFLLLGCNIFVAPYFSITFTDSLYTSFSLIILAQLMQAEQQSCRGIQTSLKTLLLITTLATFSIVLRPAALWLLAPVLLSFLRLVTKKTAALSDVILALTISSFPLLIQIVINLTHYKIMSPLPVADLGIQHLRWGIENFKYTTYLGYKYYVAFFYNSGYSLGSDLKNSPLMWYLHHPLSGSTLLTYKLISAFDFDFILPYPHSLPEHAWLASTFSLTILYLGLCGVCTHLLTNALPVLGFRYTPLLIVTAWASISLSSATELRFTLPLLTYFIVIACIFVNYLYTLRNIRFILGTIGAALIVLPLFFNVANFVREQSPRPLIAAKIAAEATKAP